MRLADLYPFWDHCHDEFLDAVALLTKEQLDARPFEKALTIRQIVLHFIEAERYWLAHLVGGYAYERPRADSYPDGQALAEAARATRHVTCRVIESLSISGLRAVRCVPADPKLNRPETNMPINWMVWHVMEKELMAWGQVSLRLDDNAVHAAGARHGRRIRRDDYRN
jgi:uncharacterized damage-inducible protein DinB